MLNRVVISLGLACTWIWMASTAYAAPSTSIVWEHEGTGFADDYGAAVGTAGDVNCDGRADLIVGIPADDQGVSGSSGSSGSGTVEVWFGREGVPATDLYGPPDWYTYTGNFDGHFGTSVAAGDVNGDGCDDLVASETSPASPLSTAQKVHVFLGPLATITLPPDSNVPPPDLPEWSATLFQRTAPLLGGQQPVSVATGDVDGNGIADVIVGQPEASNGQQEEGVVLVWLGSQFFTSRPPGTPANADWMAESNQQGAHLGESVASAFDFNGDGRDDLLAGAPDFDGVGWAFVWLGSPVLASAADGTPSNKAFSLTTGATGSRLGASVAAAGDFDGDGFGDFVVGAPNNNSYNFYTESGEALLVRGGNPMPANDTFSFYFGPTTPFAHFGTSVATAGDVNGDGLGDILVGEPDIALSSTQAGRVHLVLGRRGYSSVFTAAPPADAIYTAPNTINAFAVKSRFGAAAGTAGDWNGDGFSDVVVGAPKFGASDQGRAFVFLGKGETLASSAVFTQTIGQSGASLGLGAAFAGDINHDGYSDIVGGAPDYESTPAESGEGRIFVNYGGSCGPDCPPFFELLIPGDREANQAGAQLGRAVDGAGDVNGDGYDDVVAGAPGYDGLHFPCPIGQICPTVDAGQAYVYLGSASGLAVSPTVLLTGGNQAGSQLGYSVAGAGDVNGDGYADVIVGAPYYDAAAGVDEGRVFLYLGGASGLSASPSWIRSGGQAGAHFGIDVAGAGDVNGDGYSDVVIGADGYGTSGAAFVFLGRPTNPSFPQGLSNNPAKTLLGPQPGASFGITVASAGDLNRDGRADLVVGAPTTLTGGLQTGAVHVYHGAQTGPATTPSRTITGETPLFDPNRFGFGVAGAGDVDGDGYGELVVGDHWLTGPAGFAQGKAYVFHGSATGIAATTAAGAARTFAECPTSFCDYGVTIAGQGDANGDGFSDVLIGAFKYTDSASFQGGVFVHLGNEGNGTPLQPLQSLGFEGAPRALLGATADWFEASMNLASPAGRTRVELELEAKSIGQAFDGLGTTKSVRLDNGIDPRTGVNELGSPNDVFQWRARLRSASPLFGRSRWVSLPGNAARQMDVRVLPEPGVTVALVVGVGALASFVRSRRRMGGE